MIRVAVVDDHHAVRLGLRAALLSEPGLEAVGSATSAAEADALLYRTRPDVVLLDYQLPGADGLTLCRRIKSDVPAPGVVLYSAFADAAMTVPAIVAGVDAIVHKASQTRDLFDAIRRAARGDTTLPEIDQGAAARPRATRSTPRPPAARHAHPPHVAGRDRRHAADQAPRARPPDRRDARAAQGPDGLGALG